ncbi:MAG: DUF4097 family beta strand repeat protein [Gemmatimonadota bacterium]|nr:MAG: DUF4097 family beta strand repeat protein [Gemmatimonadota bacterium]
MYGELLLGALVAVAAPQDPRVRIDTRDLDPQVVEIEIPSIDIPEFDIYVPGFHFAVPTWEWYLQDFEIAWHDFDVHVPGVAFEVPIVHLEIPDYDWDWDDWDDRDYVQDAELDTTFAVNPNAVLGLRNHAGEIIVRTWNRNEVRIEASYSSYDRVKVIQSESSVKVKSETRHGHPEEVDYELTIPRTMAVDLWGFESDVYVDGAQNGVRVETMEGDIEITDCAGDITIHSIEGEMSVTGSSGRLEANGTDGSVVVVGFDGEIYAQSIDGDIRLEEISAAAVEGKTVDGDVFYDGTVADGGRYKLTTHDGDVVVTIPAGANATIAVATFDGEFEAEFPIQLTGAQGNRKFSFVLGDGSARLELQSFDGDIQLLRR